MSLQYPKIEPAQLGTLPAPVRRGLVDPVAIALQRILEFSRKLLRLGDNITILTLGTSSSPVYSGTEYAFQPPFRPVAFMPGGATDTSGNTILVTSWGLNLGRADGLTGITVTFGATTGIVVGIFWGAT